MDLSMRSRGIPLPERRFYPTFLILSPSRVFSRTAAQASGSKELLTYFAGEKTIDEVREEIKLATRHYAKRQLIWFRKDKVSHRLVPDKDGEVRNTSDIADEAVSRFFG